MSGCNHDDLVELARGDLNPARAEEVEAHADGCETCSHELRWLRTEKALFRTQQATPSTHVWQGIERKLVIAREQERARRRRWVQIGGAGTIMAAAASVLLLVWGGRPADVKHDDQASSQKREPDPTEDAVDRTEAFTSLETAEAEVKTAILKLEKAYARERDSLDPEEVLRFDEELQRLRGLLKSEKASAKDDVWARRRVLRAYSQYMHTMQAMVLEGQK